MSGVIRPDTLSPVKGPYLVPDAQPGHPILAELFRHNLWANLTLIDLCLTLPEKILETNAPGTYGGIR